MGFFRTKYRSDGSFDRYKAHLVAHGFTQIPELDYSHTLSHLVKSSTVFLILLLSNHQNWALRQLDVNNTCHN